MTGGLASLNTNMFQEIVLLLWAIALALMLVYAKRINRRREMIVIDDLGITINANIIGPPIFLLTDLLGRLPSNKDDLMLGPIPWDCISGARVFRSFLENG